MKEAQMISNILTRLDDHAEAIDDHAERINWLQDAVGTIITCLGQMDGSGISPEEAGKLLEKLTGKADGEG